MTFAVEFRCGNLKPFFSGQEIMQLNIDRIYYIAEFVGQFVGTFNLILFPEDRKVGVLCQDFELVERDVVIGFYVLGVINVGQDLLLIVSELKANGFRADYFLYIGSGSDSQLSVNDWQKRGCFMLLRDQLVVKQFHCISFFFVHCTDIFLHGVIIFVTCKLHYNGWAYSKTDSGADKSASSGVGSNKLIFGNRF